MSGRVDVPGQREIQVRDPVPGIVRADPGPDALSGAVMCSDGRCAIGSGDAELRRGVPERVTRRFRCAGDALAWRLFGFECRIIIALRRNVRLRSGGGNML